MRRRFVRYVQPETDRPTLLFMAAGAVAGAAAGLFLGRRYGSLGALLDDMRSRVGDLREAWDEEWDEHDDDQEPGSLGGGDEDADDEPVSESDDWDEDADDDNEDEDDDEDDEDDDDEDDESVSESDDWDEDDEDDAELEGDTDFDDELEDDLASVAASKGAGDVESGATAARRLEARVLEALSEDRRLRARAIEIAAVGDGVVELTGSVHTIEEIGRAAALVRTIPGVSMVLNRIEVRAAGHIDTASVLRDSPDADSGTEPPFPPTD